MIGLKTPFEIIATVALLIMSANAAADSGATPSQTIHLCGWWSNPTPNNAWLRDGKVEYAASIQGDFTAHGDWPEFPKSRWVAVGYGGYGYGCACLDAVVDGSRIASLKNARSRPLKACRSSRILRRAEPVVR